MGKDKSGIRLRVREIRLPLGHEESEIPRAICSALGIVASDLLAYSIAKQSIDARKKHVIYFTYVVDVTVHMDAATAAHLLRHPHIEITPSVDYVRPEGAPPLTPPCKGGAPELRPVVIGTGPCGLFAGLSLAQMGLRPLLIERGKPVGERVADVNRFWREGVLDPKSNVQFGEGGAGTFSDGKLTTQIKDRHNRVRKVLEELIAAGADEEILYRNKPHIGTDVLVRVVLNLRRSIESLGGEFFFETPVSDFLIENSSVRGVVLEDGREMESDLVILAIGHSARDTFAVLRERGVAMQPKPFSIGVRIEHLQELIDRDQFGEFAGHPDLGHADYRLVHHCTNGRSVYTFCMCPGGEVIGASSEPGGLVTNGMSRHLRDKPNANSALLVGVRPEDFGGNDMLAGVEFQREWERRAYELAGGNYSAPVQLVGDLLQDRPSRQLGSISPSYKPGFRLCQLKDCLPNYVIESFREALPIFDRKIPGFAAPDVPMTGVETRSSSPIRMVRDEGLESVTVKGLFPAGEGAGYAGGIVSSAVDGIKVAEKVGQIMANGKSR